MKKRWVGWKRERDGNRGRLSEIRMVRDGER